MSKVILDMDPGIDDALALLLALRSPEIQVLGVTTVAGNAPVEMTSANARRVLEYLGVTDIPVAMGAAKPLKHPLVDALDYHGPDGLGQCGLPPPKLPPHRAKAWDFLAESVLNAPGEVTLVATGPLTNVALAFQHHPELPSFLARLVLMGGAYGLTPHSKGNKTPFAEFNIWQDPEAAHIVFSSGADIFAVGLDVSMNPATCLNDQHLEQIKASYTPSAHLAAKLVEYVLKHHGHCELHDPLALTVLLDASLFDFISVPVELITGNGWDRGITRILPSDSCQLIHVAARVDGPRFLKLFLSHILRTLSNTTCHCESFGSCHSEELAEALNEVKRQRKDSDRRISLRVDSARNLDPSLSLRVTRKQHPDWRNKMTKLVVCGAINWDVSCFVEHLPTPGEEVTVKHITRVSGGTGGNVAVTAVRILGPKQVALIGALGEDDIAPRQIAALATEGVITEGIDCVPGEESGQAYILVDQEGQNVIASCLGANAKLCREHLNKPPVRGPLQECQGIVLTDPPLDVAAELINLAKQRRIPVLWDPGISISYRWEMLEPLAKQADVLFLNETEAIALLGTAEVDMSLKRLHELGLRNHTVLKLGAQGAAMLQPATGTAIEVPALPLRELGLKVINTVGCGDVFVGAFAAYRVLGASMQKSLIMASVAAGFNATRPETRGSPERATLETTEQHSRDLGFTFQERKPPSLA